MPNGNNEREVWPVVSEFSFHHHGKGRVGPSKLTTLQPGNSEEERSPGQDIVPKDRSLHNGFPPARHCLQNLSKECSVCVPGGHFTSYYEEILYSSNKGNLFLMWKMSEERFPIVFAP